MDLEGLEVKAGLECHQQLDTKKLFCRCPSILREDPAHATVKRYLRPSASEMGEFDSAALEQFKRGNSYIYEYYNDTTCEIELDEAPPKEVEPEALKTVFEIALLTNAKILKKVFMMRKLVIDGSNTSGFQRTGLVAVDGKIKLKEKELGIQTIVLEEDASRPIKKTGKEIVYRVDRLGIPLIEIATAPELHTPEEVKEAALAIGNLFRRTGRIKRGLGTIRQDVNVSIKNGARIEIKGVQELELIDEFVRREIQRQKTLLEIKEELQKRGVTEADLQKKETDVSGIFSNTQCKFIKEAKEKKVFAAKINGFNGIFGKETQPQRRFGTEVSDYVKARSGASGIIHSDELPAYGISEKEIEEVKQAVFCTEKDAFAIVVDEEEKARKGLQTAIDRCIVALYKIPAETRNALDGGNTEYSRPLSGSARLYPETDIGPIEYSKEYVQEIKKTLPLTGQERLELYTKKFGLSEKIANEMKLHNFARFFERMAKKGHNPTQVAVILLQDLTQVKRMGADPNVFSQEMLQQFFEKIQEGKIKHEIIVETLFEWAKNPIKQLQEILHEKNFDTAEKSEMEQIIREIIKQNEQMIKEKGNHSMQALMGMAMKMLKGKATGKEVNDALTKEMKQVMQK